MFKCECVLCGNARSANNKSSTSLIYTGIYMQTELIANSNQQIDGTR